MLKLKIISIKPSNIKKVYDLTVSGNHNFFIGKTSILTHNCDYINPNSTQPALRNFMETFSKNTGFILTCNFKNRIIEPLHSRCTVIDFKISKKDMAKLATLFFKRVELILNIEGITYDKAVVAEVIQKYFPDWRRVLNELQRYSATGTIDSGILSNLKETSIKELISFMKDKNYTEMRNWVSVNLDTDVNTLYRQFYDTAGDLLEKSSVPLIIILIAKYQYQNAFSVDPTINFMAFLTECMIECKFNDN